MNIENLTPDALDTLAAEYALGSQTLRVRRRIAAYAEHKPAFAERIERWQQSLAPLGADLPPIEPHSRVWKGIEARLGFARAKVNELANESVKPKAINQEKKVVQSSAASNDSWWNRIAIWRNMSFAASALAGLMAFFVLLPGGFSGLFSADVEPDCYFLLQGEGDAPKFSVTEFHQRNELLIKPVERQPVTQGKALQLWAVVGDVKVPVGVVSETKSTTIKMDPRVKSALYAKGARMAVSVEPAGVAADKPTGPIKCIGSVLMTGKGMKNSPAPFV